MPLTRTSRLVVTAGRAVLMVQEHKDRLPEVGAAVPLALLVLVLADLVKSLL